MLHLQVMLGSCGLGGGAQFETWFSSEKIPMENHQTYVTKGQKFINEKEEVEPGVANSTSYRIKNAQTEKLLKLH